MLRRAIYVWAAVVVALVATLFLSVLQIYGSSMSPSLEDGDVVISVKAGTPERGDVIAFYYNSKILVKRVIAGPGDRVHIDQAGAVYINGDLLEEPYLREQTLAPCNMDLPYQVPGGRWFVMGDHRSVSVDSRDKSLGCVAEEQIAGRLRLRVWPLNRMTRFR